MSSAAHNPSHEMTCLEVWGGNSAVDATVALPGLDVWVHSRPCGGAPVGGDVHYLSSCGTGRITRLLVADVAGHGESVAATADLLRGLMRRFVNHINQAQLVSEINHHFTELTAADRFATAVVATYFAPVAELSLCNAGHPPPLWYRQSEKRWTVLTDLELPEVHDQARGGITASDHSPGNIPLGIVDAEQYGDFTVRLQPGDLVLLYTDSLPESRQGGDGALLGLRGLLQRMQPLDVTAPAALLPRLVDQIMAYTGGHGCEDDLTTLLIRATDHRGGASLKKKLVGTGRFVADLLRGRVRRFPWPEFTVNNVGGALFLPLSRWKRRS